jgi:hypothetical protein
MKASFGAGFHALKPYPFDSGRPFLPIMIGCGIGTTAPCINL